MIESNLQKNEFFRTILAFLRTFKEKPVYLVGGAVRDALLGKPSHDFDFIVDGDALTVARRLADSINGAFYVLDGTRNYARVIGSDEQGMRTIFDFAPLYQNDLQIDLRSRDFSINAIACAITSPGSALIDPLHGREDLEKRILRPCSDRAFVDDPVRMVRAARFAVEYQLTMPASVYRQIRENVPALADVSEERKRDELFKIFENEDVPAALEILEDTRMLESVLPEVQRLVGFQQGSPHHFDGWGHTLKALAYCEAMANYLAEGDRAEGLSKWMIDLYHLLDEFSTELRALFSSSIAVERSLRSLFLFAALCHDIGKPLDVPEQIENRTKYPQHAQLGARAMEKRSRAMALGKLEIQWLQSFIRCHMQLHDLDVSSSMAEQRIFLYRFFKSAGQTSPFVALFSLADLLATYDAAMSPDRWRLGLVRCEKALHGWFHEYAALVAPEPLLDGVELQNEFNLKPGKELGNLLARLCEAQAAGKVRTKQQAQEWIGSLLAKKKD
jgi:tRNA nucleotidyltransferase/poly(A) polymerase